MVSFFDSRGDQLVAEKLAISPWTPANLSGTGVCGVLARELENHCPDGFVPARFTADLYRPVLNARFDMRTTVVRPCVSDIESSVARSRC
ncbi:hypothetical protein [Nocardia sp. NBC_00416]|uniref:hypothetical protein n=1 Tax=Nocardia sp. NBC_00416 TaxID=2975991 RepID=UPI002E1B84F3